MSVQVKSHEFRGELIVLGSGTSVGVPAVGCPCEVCRSPNPRNHRTRCAVILGLPEGNLLIDTPPDLRQQLLREGIGLVHAVLYTHEHADHLFGLDDLRLMQFYLGAPVPVYSSPRTEARIRASFDYAFSEEEPTHAGAVPALDLRTIGEAPFACLNATIQPIPLRHGPKFDVLGFRVGNVAYCTDTNGIPPASRERLLGLDTLILDALRWRPHATHFCLDEAVEVARDLGAKQTYFTHICHDLEHEATNAQLPAGMALAYDGLRIPLT